MPTYIGLYSYTAQGIADVKDSPARLDAAKDLLKELKGGIRHFFMTMGQYALVVIFEAPDDGAAAKFSLKLGSKGNVRSQTMKAFTETEYRRIIAGL